MIEERDIRIINGDGYEAIHDGLKHCNSLTAMPIAVFPLLVRFYHKCCFIADHDANRWSLEFPVDSDSGSECTTHTIFGIDSEAVPEGQLHCQALLSDSPESLVQLDCRSKLQGFPKGHF